MKKQMEEKNGAAVLEELIRQLTKNENVCRMLGDLNAHNPDVLVAQLVEELERIIKWQHLQYELLAKAPAPPPPSEPSELEQAPKPELGPAPKPAAEPQEAPKPGLPEPEPQTEPVLPADVPVVQPTSPEAGVPEGGTLPESIVPTSELEHLGTEESEASIRKQLPRVPSDLGMDDYLYLH